VSQFGSARIRRSVLRIWKRHATLIVCSQLLASSLALGQSPEEASSGGQPATGNSHSDGVGGNEAQAAVEDESAGDQKESASSEESATESTEASPQQSSTSHVSSDAELVGAEHAAHNMGAPSQLSAADSPLTQEEPKSLERRKDSPTTIRWSSVGGFVGVVSRPSSSDSFHYKAGVAYGGYFRPEIFSWLGIRLYYRKEFIPVDVEPGAFNFAGLTPDLSFEQPPLNVTSLGFRVEPSWVVHPRFRVLGVLGLSWLRFVAEMPTAPGFDLRADRAGVELNWGVGAGASFDLVENWIELSAVWTYNFVASQSGSAYEPIQGIYQGKKVYLGPLPELKNANDLIFQLGLIL
jgi:opacity protein-like surface antigen